MQERDKCPEEGTRFEDRTVFKINANKTKVLSMTENRTHPISINRQNIKDVEQFVCLDIPSFVNGDIKLAAALTTLSPPSLLYPKSGNADISIQSKTVWSAPTFLMYFYKGVTHGK